MLLLYYVYVQREVEFGLNQLNSITNTVFSVL